MKNTSFAHQAGMTLGAVFGLWHFAWAVLILTNVAQPLMDWVLRLHMIESSYTILPFSLGNSVILIVITSVIGYVLGYAFGSVWKAMEK